MSITPGVGLTVLAVGLEGVRAVARHWGGNSGIDRTLVERRLEHTKSWFRKVNILLASESNCVMCFLYYTDMYTYNKNIYKIFLVYLGVFTHV